MRNPINYDYTDPDQLIIYSHYNTNLTLKYEGGAPYHVTLDIYRISEIQRDDPENTNYLCIGWLDLPEHLLQPRPPNSVHPLVMSFQIKMRPQLIEDIGSEQEPSIIKNIRTCLQPIFSPNVLMTSEQRISKLYGLTNESPMEKRAQAQVDVIATEFTATVAKYDKSIQHAEVKGDAEAIQSMRERNAKLVDQRQIVQAHASCATSVHDVHGFFANTRASQAVAGTAYRDTLRRHTTNHP